MHDDGDLILESEVKNNLWSIRPCHLYKGLIEVFDFSQLTNKFFLC